MYSVSRHKRGIPDPLSSLYPHAPPAIIPPRPFPSVPINGMKYMRTAWEIMVWLTQILCIFQYIFVPVCGLDSVYTHKTLRNYTFYERYAASVYGVCQVYSNSICDYLYNDLSMARGSYFPHKAHASMQLGWKGNVWFTLILCAITYIMIRVWAEVAISRTRLMRSYNWYEKYVAGM